MTCRFGKMVTVPSAANSWSYTGCILAPQLSLARKVNCDVRFARMTADINRLQLSSLTNITTARALFKSRRFATILSNDSSVTILEILNESAIQIPKR